MIKALSALFPLKWEASISSEVGPNRNHNEDCAYIHKDSKLKIAILCDGVGGNNAGEVASQLCCQLLSEQLNNIKPSKLSKAKLKNIIQSVHSNLIEKGNQLKDTQGMATTLVCLIVTHQKKWVIWAGDSRAYLLNTEKKLTQLTYDHSFVAEKVAQGIFTEEEAQAHPMASMITSSMGGTLKSLRHIGVEEIQANKGDRIILLSDGVYSFVSNEQLIQAAQDSAQAITQLAIKANTSDNCSAIVIQIY